jgi:hypothetical protein
VCVCVCVCACVCVCVCVCVRVCACVCVGGYCAPSNTSTRAPSHPSPPPVDPLHPTSCLVVATVKTTDTEVAAPFPGKPRMAGEVTVATVTTLTSTGRISSCTATAAWNVTLLKEVTVRPGPDMDTVAWGREGGNVCEGAEGQQLEGV